MDSVFRSRRFWVAIAGVLIAISEELGLSIPSDTIIEIVLLAGAWILGDSIRKTE